MYIPITVGQGIVETVFTPKLSGDYTADCQMIVGEVVYDVGEVASVRRGTEIKLRAEALEDREFTVTLDGINYTWYVKKPTDMKAVEEGGFYKLVGAYTELNVGDRILTLQEGAGNDDLIIPDYGNELILSVDLSTGNFRSVSAPGLVDIAVSPVLAFSSLPTKICALLRKADGAGCALVVFDAQLNETSRSEYTHVPTNGVNSLRATVDGFLCNITKTTRIAIRYDETRDILSTPNNNKYVKAGGLSLVVSPGVNASVLGLQTDTDNQMGYDARVTFSINNVSAKSVLIADSYDERIVVIDQTTGFMFTATASTTSGGALPVTSAYIGNYGAISSVVIDTDLSVLVGFFDEGIKRFVNGVFVEQVSDVGTSYLLRTDEELIYTRLHDTDIVYSVKQDVVTLELDPTEVRLNTARARTFQYEAEIGGPAKLINNLGTVTVNGKPFDGMLPAQCTIVFTMPGTANYYHFRKMGIVGAKAYEWDVLSEPQLVMNTVTLPPRYDAQIRTYEYEEITISGITEGYTEEIRSLSENVTLQVNDGEWSDRITVTTKDKVLVRWYLERYSAQYAPTNEIRFVRNNALFASWYVLKMGLDGVEIQKEHGEQFHITDTWQEDDKSIPVNSVPEISTTHTNSDVVLTPSWFDYDGPKYVGTSTTMSVASSLFELGLTGSADGCTSFELCVDGQVLPKAAYSYFFGVAGVSSSSRIAYSNTTIEDRGTTTIASIATTPLVKDGAYTELVYAGVDRSMPISSFEYVAYYWSFVQAANRDVFSTTDVGEYKAFFECYAQTAVEVSTRFTEVPYNVEVVAVGRDMYARPAYDRGVRKHDSGIYIRMDERGAARAYFAADTPYVLTASAVYYDENGSEFVLDATKFLTISMGMTMNQPPIYRTFSTTPTTVKYRIVEFNVTAAGSNQGGMKVYAFNVTADAASGSDLIEVESTPAFRKGKTAVVGVIASADRAARLELVRATVEFRTSHFRDVDIEDGLFTQEQAISEAELYAANGLPSVAKVGDSYIVHTLPLLGDSECMPGELVGVPTKTFGYLGGG